jgi:large subunit ribosomal protein L33
MAKKKKGPRQAAGLYCSVCKKFNYITEFNKNNDILQKQLHGESAFPLNKYCSTCRKHTLHKQSKKLK